MDVDFYIKPEKKRKDKKHWLKIITSWNLNLKKQLNNQGTQQLIPDVEGTVY